MVVATLILSYFFYVMLTIRASSDLVKDGHGTEAEDELYLKHYFKLPNNIVTVVSQAAIGFAGLVYFCSCIYFRNYWYITGIGHSGILTFSCANSSCN